MSDPELIEFVKEFAEPIMGDDPKGMCFMVCAPLSDYLNLCGVSARLVSGEVEIEVNGEKGITNHYWIKLGDGRILDPTISQFDSYEEIEPIYLGTMPNWFIIA